MDRVSHGCRRGCLRRGPVGGRNLIKSSRSFYDVLTSPTLRWIMNVLAESGYGPGIELEPQVCWQAAYSRDARFDGRFFAGAVTTRVYCRSTCPVPFARPD